MTICLATDSYPPHNSGIATHNLYLVRLLVESGIKVIVLTADFSKIKEEDTVTDQGDVVIVTLKKSYGVQHRYFSQFIRSGNREAAVWLSLGMAMRQWLTNNTEKYGIDLIEFSDYGGFGLFLIDKQFPPAVMMCHGMLTQLNKKEFHNRDENLAVIRFLEMNALKLADNVICHSHSNAKDLKDTFQVKTMYATAPWINDSIISARPVKTEFIIASRLQVCKGALVIANTLQSLQKEHPEIKVTWIGEDTYTAPEGWMVSKYIKKHFPAIWQKSFIWKKAIPRKQLMEEIEASETVIIPSTWETFNYVVLEAANRKKSMIITKQAGIASVIGHTGNYLLADANDVHSVKKAMIKLHTHKSTGVELAANMSAATSKIFDRLNFIDDRKKAYDLAIDRRKHHKPVNPLEAFFIPLDQ